GERRAAVVGAAVLRLLAADAGADDVALAPGGDLFADARPGAVHPALIGVGDDVGGDRTAPGRELGEAAGLQVPVDGHGDGPGNRGGRHDPRVRGALGLGAQRVPLLAAEAVLLVDHHEAEVGE